MAAKKKANKGKRYSEAEKAEILQWADAQGRGGQTKASKKFGVSPLTISNWRKAAGGGEIGNGLTAKATRKAKEVAHDLEGLVAGFLHKMGYTYEIWTSHTSGNVKREVSKSLEALGLFGGSDYKVVRVERGEPVVEMKLSKLLEITKTKP